jgi:O-antigen/teichoic acid export membrane protein
MDSLPPTSGISDRLSDLRRPAGLAGTATPPEIEMIPMAVGDGYQSTGEIPVRALPPRNSVKRNIVANYLGQGWTAVVGLAFVPVFISYLGIEAYGVIGLFALMQGWLSLLDMGMTPTLNREMARYTAGVHSAQSIRNLLRTLEIIAASIAVIIALAVWAASHYLATDWLKVQTLPIPVIAQALSVMGVVVALRFVEGIYRGSLFGLQAQIWYNVAAAILATLRYAGAIAVLAWVSPTLTAFFFWQAFVSFLSVAVLGRRVHLALPHSQQSPTFSAQALIGVWRFAAGMIGITLLSILLTQVDKLLLSRMLTLEFFGYYTLAAAAAAVITMIVNPITQAIYPRMVELTAIEAEPRLVSVYHQGAQLVTVLTAPAAMLLAFFAGGIVFMWSGNADLSRHAAPILTALALGAFLNGLMWMPYQCQLAHGWTSLMLKANVVAVALLIPAIIWVVPRYGAVGAARIWVALNLGYVVIIIQLMHRRLIAREKWRWYSADVLVPLGGSFAITLIAGALAPSQYQNRLHWLVFLLMTGILSLSASALLATDLRPQLARILGRVSKGTPRTT